MNNNTNNELIINMNSELEFNIGALEDTSIKDRRKRKTQTAVEKALISLLHQKPIEEISISELAEKADINRKTFYNNYQSIDDVLHGIDRKMSKYIYSKLPERITINNENEILPLLLELTKIMAPFKDILYQITMHRGSFIMMEQIQKLLRPYIEKSLSSYEIEPIIADYINQCVANELSTIYFEWFKKDNLSNKQVATLAYNIVIAIIRLDNYKNILKI